MPREKATWREMTVDEQRMAKALGRCSFSPASWDKRFARTLSGQAGEEPTRIIEKQSEHLHRMTHRYRRQIPARVVALSTWKLS